MDRTTRVLAALSATAVSVAALAFSPAPAPTAPSVDASAREFGLRVTADGEVVRTIDGVELRERGLDLEQLRDPLAHRDGLRAEAALRGIETWAATDACTEECTEECTEGCEAEPVPVSTWVFQVGYDDLDGDGTDDLLVLTETFDHATFTGSSAVEARSGADASLLWSLDGGAQGFVSPSPDLDGDGVADLLWTSYDYAYEFEDCGDEDTSCYAESYSQTASFVAVSGASGSGLGTHELEGSGSYKEYWGSSSTPTSSEHADGVEADAVNLFGFPRLADLDGDGTHALVYDTLDVSYRESHSSSTTVVLQSSASSVTEEAHGRVVSVDLATGTETIVVDGPDQLLFADVIADGDHDVLLVDAFAEYENVEGECTGVTNVGSCLVGEEAERVEPTPPTRTLYDDGTARWSTSIPADSIFVEPVGSDLNGDGTNDLFDLGIDFDGAGLVTTAIDGATGAAIWTVDGWSTAYVDGLLLNVTSTLDMFQEDEEAVSYTVSVHGSLVDPQTGESGPGVLLGTASYHDDGGEQIEERELRLRLDDVVGDGIADVLAFASDTSYAVAEFCEQFEDPDGEPEEFCFRYPEELLALSTSLTTFDGSTLTPEPTRDLGTNRLAGLLDVDADGRTEIITRDPLSVPDTVVTSALTIDGAPLWTLPVGESLDDHLHSADAVSLLTRDDEGLSRARSGDDLALQWEADLGVDPYTGDSSFVIIVVIN